MQKILAKYGLAAHLAILAVAPLFLFICGLSELMATALFWLSALVLVWVFLSPSVLRDELPHQARRRVVRHVLKDPLTWALLVLTMSVGLCSLNTGVGLLYDAESQTWFLSSASLAWMPGMTAGVGCRPFAVCFALLATTLGARHALGGSARVAFLLLSSAISGSLAFVALLMPGCCADLSGMIRQGTACLASSAGVAFLFNLVCAVVTLSSIFERGWVKVIPLFILAVGGNLVGSVVFSGVFFQAVFAPVLVLFVGYAFLYLHFLRMKNGEYRYLAVVGIMLTAGAFFAYALLPGERVAGLVSAFAERNLLPEGYLKMQSVLSDVAVRAWKEHAWIGTGIGSIPFVIKFGVADADWEFVPNVLSVLPNGWWQRLVESGLLGAVALLLPVFSLFFAYGTRLSQTLAGGQWLLRPLCWFVPTVLSVISFLLFFDGAPLGAESIVLIGTVCALSVSELPRGRKR